MDEIMAGGVATHKKEIDGQYEIIKITSNVGFGYKELTLF